MCAPVCPLHTCPQEAQTEQWGHPSSCERPLGRKVLEHPGPTQGGRKRHGRISVERQQLSETRVDLAVGHTDGRRHRWPWRYHRGLECWVASSPAEAENGNAHTNTKTCKSVYGGGCTGMISLGKFHGGISPPLEITQLQVPHAHPACKPMLHSESERFNRIATESRLDHDIRNNLLFQTLATVSSAIGIFTALPAPRNFARGKLRHLR